jgi:hypothetical protein
MNISGPEPLETRSHIRDKRIRDLELEFETFGSKAFETSKSKISEFEALAFETLEFRDKGFGPCSATPFPSPHITPHFIIIFTSFFF